MKKNICLIAAFAFLFFSYNCIGPQGEDGEDGNANVGAAIYDVETSYWSGDEDGYVATLSVPEITENVYYNGAVLVYMLCNEDSDYPSFNQLPYTWVSGDFTEYMDFEAYIGEIDVFFRYVQNSLNCTEAPTSLYTYKVIVIEGTSLTKLQEEIDINDPDVVLDYFNK